MASRDQQGPFVKAEKDDLYQRSQETGQLGFKIAMKKFIHKYQSVEMVKSGKTSAKAI